MLALLGDAAAAAARFQHGVGGRRAIAADDLDIAARTALAIGFPHQIHQARVHLGRFVATPVAQEEVQLLEAGLIIAAVALEDDFVDFAGVQIAQLERAHLGMGGASRDGKQASRHRGAGKPFPPDAQRGLTPVLVSFDSAQIKRPCRLPFVPGFDQTGMVDSHPIIDPNG